MTHNSRSRISQCLDVSQSFGSRIFVESKSDQIVLRSSMGRRRSGDVVAFLAVLHIRISMVISMDRWSRGSTCRVRWSRSATSRCLRTVIFDSIGTL
jgi:hypothetical protein